ncbi:MAG TPA: hypothetical protein VM577_14510 [Anaerovoracaceae bacterium]|nr:hypothetical protein [Anaerovoracaceae bacterium]
MITIAKCFSILVASGNGNRCDRLRSTIRDQLLNIDPGSGQLKVTVHKYGKRDNKAYLKICQEVAESIQPMFLDIDQKFFCQDNKAQSDELQSDKEILSFRRLLENSMRQGRWAGRMADQS